MSEVVDSPVDRDHAQDRTGADREIPVVVLVEPAGRA
jgi:hypothetical protein